MKTNKLSEKLKLDLHHFLSETSPQEMKEHLGEIYLGYLDRYEAPESQSPDVRQWLTMQALFGFLETAATETTGWERCEMG